MRVIVFLALAGALGSLSRYGLSGVVQRFAGADFLYGTLVINVLGCLAIGFIMQIALNTDIIPSVVSQKKLYIYLATNDCKADIETLH